MRRVNWQRKHFWTIQTRFDNLRSDSVFSMGGKNHLKIIFN